MPPAPLAELSANECQCDGEDKDESERTKTEQDEVPVPGEITQTKDPTREIQPLRSETQLLLGYSETPDSPVQWRVSIRGNPHLMIVGLPGMGKTTVIVNMCAQLFRQGILPIVFSYHNDIETELEKHIGRMNHVDLDNGIGFNPLTVVSTSPHAWLDNVGMLRDIFAAIHPDLGEIQTNEIREAIKESYVELGYGVPGVECKNLPVPRFQRFFEILKQREKPNQGVMARLEELDDYGFFSQVGEEPRLLETQEPTVIRIHRTQNAVVQNALAAFVLLSVYQNMFLRGTQDAVTHAIVFDEAHRAGRLKLIPIMAKESRKFGISFLLSSQAAKDFDPLLYSAIANYLVLRVTEADALALAKHVTDSGGASRLAGRFKHLEKFTAMFFSEGERPVRLSLCTAVS
jgi:hypothetical protein